MRTVITGTAVALLCAGLIGCERNRDEVEVEPRDDAAQWDRAAQGTDDRIYQPAEQPAEPLYQEPGVTEEMEPVGGAEYEYEHGAPAHELERDRDIEHNVPPMDSGAD